MCSSDLFVAEPAEEVDVSAALVAEGPAFADADTREGIRGGGELLDEILGPHRGELLPHRVGAAAPGMEEIPEDEQASDSVPLHERLEPREVPLRRAFGNRYPRMSKRGRLAEVQVGDEQMLHAAIVW